MKRNGELSQAMLARRLGISPAAVTKAKAQGMPTSSVAAARAWRRAHLDPAHTKPEPGAPPPRRAIHRPPSTKPGGGEQRRNTLTSTPFQQARTAREVYEAKLAQLRYEVETGHLVDAEQLRAALARRVAAFRAALLQIPERTAPLLVGVTPAQTRAVLRRAFLDALAHLEDDHD